MKRVTVIVVNWNGKQFLSECLESLRHQSYRNFSTVVVDNGSEDDSVAFIEYHFPELRLIRLSHNTGFAYANNIAMKEADTEYIALLNNDAVADERWLESLVNALDACPEAGMAGSKMLFYDAKHIIDRVGDAYSTAGTGLLRGRGMSSESYDKPEKIFGACAGAALYRTDMLGDVGLFDEDFFLLYEDVDLSFRAQLKGYECLYVPDAIVYHKASATIVHDSPTSVYYSHRNLEWTYLGNMPTSLIFKSLILHIVYDLASFLYFLSCGRGKEFVRAKTDAFKGFKAVMNKRRKTQSERRVTDEYIWRLFEHEKFLPRLTRRLKRND
jgi:GT2 family glycosyltransferase